MGGRHRPVSPPNVDRPCTLGDLPVARLRAPTARSRDCDEAGSLSVFSAIFSAILCSAGDSSAGSRADERMRREVNGDHGDFFGDFSAIFSANFSG